MAVIGVLGAAGALGERVAVEARARGHDLHQLSYEETHARDPSAVAAVANDVDVVINALAPPIAGRATQAFAASSASARRVVIDLNPEPAAVAAVYAADERRAFPATVVPGAGMQYVVGDLLAHMAAQSVDKPDEVHIAYVFPDDPMFRAASRGRRSAFAAALDGPALAYIDGVVQPQPLGAWRRLAWFPRPIGPSHAAEIGGAEAFSVPLHVDANVVRTYLAVGGWRAEVLTTMANAMRFAPTRRLLMDRLTRGRTKRKPDQQARRRWAVVAEVATTSRADPDSATTEALGSHPSVLHRAWAYGRDLERLSAICAVAMAERALDTAEVGVFAPSQLADARTLLDDLSARTDLRWSVAT